MHRHTGSKNLCREHIRVVYDAKHAPPASLARRDQMAKATQTCPRCFCRPVLRCKDQGNDGYGRVFHLHTQPRLMRDGVHARTHARTHERTHARTHARTHTHTHTHTHTWARREDA